jgi:hypothetical protein
MVALGLDLGSWLKLSDKIGFYKVMVLVCSPVEFLLCNTLQLFGIVYRDV